MSDAGAENSDDKDTALNEEDQSNSETTKGTNGDAPLQTSKVANTVENSQPATQEQLAEVKEDLSAFEKVTLRWTRTTTGIGFVTAVFICLQWCEMHSSSIDTHNLADAASKQAIAAGRFADSASKINAGVGDAVTKLNLQAAKLEESVRQASRLARDTEIANQNAIEGDRPWFGGTIVVTDFEVGKIPKATVRFLNSGKRPASIISAMTHSRFYAEFPKDPFYEAGSGELYSKSFAVPGDGVVLASNILGIPLSQEVLDGLNKTPTPTVVFYVYGKVIYTDIRTRREHFTHACVQYAPATVAREKGFYSCTPYNEGN